MLAKSTNATELNLTILTMSGLGLASARVFLADKTRQSVLTVLSAACGLALLGMATSPAIVYGEFSRSWPTIAYDGTVLAQIAIAACVALYAVASVVHRRRLSLHTTAILFALVPATVAWHLMPISPLSTIVVANCGVATIALAIAIYGVREDDSTWTTIGCILAFGLILLRLSDADEPRLVVGTLLVGVGIGVLLMARAYLLRKKDPLAAQDEPATAEQLDLPTNNAPQPE